MAPQMLTLLYTGEQFILPSLSLSFPFPLLYLYSEIVSLHISAWLGTHYIDQADFELNKDPLASAS